MKKKNKALLIGLILFLLGGIILFIQGITHFGLSDMLGRLYCGYSYLQPVDSQQGDGMCGFNMDMVVGIASFLLLAAGLVFLVIGVVKVIAGRRKSRTAQVRLQ